MESSSNTSTIKINLYGKTGAGKSTLCNIILGREEFKVGHDLESCTSLSEYRNVDWKNFPPVQLTDTPGFGDNRVGATADQMAQIVTDTSKGLNIALFLISTTGTRFDDADIRGIQIIGHLLTEAGVPHIYLVFTQVDRLATESEKTGAIAKWTEQSFAVLEANDVHLPKTNFYVLRSGKESDFVEWLKEKVPTLPKFKPPQYKKTKKLLKKYNGNKVAVYMGLSRSYEGIAKLEAKRKIHIY